MRAICEFLPGKALEVSSWVGIEEQAMPRFALFSTHEQASHVLQGRISPTGRYVTAYVQAYKMVREGCEYVRREKRPAGRSVGVAVGYADSL